MISDGMLLFLAEVQRIASILGGRRLIDYCRVRDPKVRQVLHQVGFFNAVGRPSRLVPTAKDVIHWRAISGQGAEGQKADNLVKDVRGRLPDALKAPMYAGLVEAMTNCAQHAYRNVRQDDLDQPGNGEWWMFAREQDQAIAVVICDLGIGIPNSLPLTQGDGPVRELLARIGRASGLAHSDAALVDAAVQIGRSRTGEPNRGKGLQDVVDVIKAARTGTLVIHSNSGCYVYSMKDGQPAESTRDYRTSILGTLIFWSVPVQ
jgi:anti-sigma regulatory factor (Ser/Thr protein kinase)